VAVTTVSQGIRASESRKIVAAIATETPARTYSRCEWCGSPCYGRSCQAHRDLNQLEREAYAA